MRTLILVLALCSIASPAGAAGVTPETRAQAKQQYEAGERAFRLGDFDKAIKEWRDSYELSSVPLLLYNIGQAYRQKSDAKQALFFYQQFIATGATGDSRKIAEQRVEELKQVVEAQRKAQEAPPTGTAPAVAVGSSAPPQGAAPISATSSSLETRSVRSWYRSPIGWTLSGVGLAGIGVGVGLVAHSLDLNDQANRASTLTMRQSLENSSSAYGTAGYVALGVGGAAIVGGVIVFVVAGSRDVRPSVAFLNLKMRGVQ